MMKVQSKLLFIPMDGIIYYGTALHVNAILKTSPEALVFYNRISRMFLNWEPPLLLLLLAISQASVLDRMKINTNTVAAEPFFFKGHDLSSLKYLEETGTSYKDTAKNDQNRPAEDILGDGGMNTVRLR
jgi:arabinogalactan endo-1,4-beta-galactosidase